MFCCCCLGLENSNNVRHFTEDYRRCTGWDPVPSHSHLEKSLKDIYRKYWYFKISELQITESTNVNETGKSVVGGVAKFDV